MLEISLQSWPLVYILSPIPTHLHGVDEHSSETERNLLGKLLPCHRHFEAVSKVNVRDLATHTVQHQVGGVPENYNKLCHIYYMEYIVYIIHGSKNKNDSRIYIFWSETRNKNIIF